MKKIELYKQICDLPNKYENRDLETYLLALYALVESHEKQSLTDDLFLEIISSAFTSEPCVFQEVWLNYDQLPYNHKWWMRKVTNPEVKEHIDKTSYRDTIGIDFTKNVLKFQIAELHKMRNNQLKNELRYFGIKSETGHFWYNFNPFTNLECGVRCLIDHANNENELLELNWQTLGEILEDGRIYE
jgi:hypothetical protein